MPQAITPLGKRFAFVHSKSAKATKAYRMLTHLYGQNPAETADIIVAIGGDGFMLETLNKFGSIGKPVYGMNRGTEGFLLNKYILEDLAERLDAAVSIKIRRLNMIAVTAAGEVLKAKAINDIALLRETGQSAHLAVYVDDVLRIKRLVCDGILLATPAGSTAYNLSAHGPIIPLSSNLLALTPISPFRPRRWSGALISHHSKVRIDILNIAKRPVSVSADANQIHNVSRVEMETDHRHSLNILFEHDQILPERILREQFSDS